MKGSCEGGNEISGTVKGGWFLEYLSNSYFLNRGSVPAGSYQYS
jgi:hypothetical protein